MTSTISRTPLLAARSAMIVAQCRAWPALAAAALFAACAQSRAMTDEEEENLAKQLANPVAAVVSVPIQLNLDRRVGPADGRRSTLIVQPVIPFDLSPDWNLITRTILPLVDQRDVAGPSGDQFGLADTFLSLFLAPKRSAVPGLVVGAGPVFLLPTATDPLLGTKKWSAGPTGLVMSQQGQWTLGLLANHVWSFAGSASRPDVSASLVQPFAAYVTHTSTTFSLNAEVGYNWEAKDWAIPVSAGVSQLFVVGRQPMQFGVFARYWAQSAENGPQGWGLRLQYTLIFPR
jgi:Putative MetA-pathway of phenol degradation